MLRESGQLYLSRGERRDARARKPLGQPKSFQLFNTTRTSLKKQSGKVCVALCVSTSSSSSSPPRTAADARRALSRCARAPVDAATQLSKRCHHTHTQPFSMRPIGLPVIPPQKPNHSVCGCAVGQTKPLPPSKYLPLPPSSCSRAVLRRLSLIIKPLKPRPRRARTPARPWP